MPILFLVFTLNTFTQGYRVAGEVFDLETGDPISDVTVYINGTTKGTISDGSGQFNMDGIALPCELILSHVSYDLKLIPLQDTTMLVNQSFFLQKSLIKLEEATIIHDQLRKDYVRRFKAWFLGVDYERYNADILNDSILIFIIKENEQFSVYANEPIIVDLPATGYTLKVDLVKFDLLYKEELQGYHCSILGYYYFNPLEPETPRKQRTIARNRTEHYYNSSRHFCRSLYHNALAENGYLFERNCIPENGEVSDHEFIHDMRASYGPDEYGNQHLLLTGFACKKFSITFYYNARNRPVDLTFRDSHPTRMEWSGLQFLHDSIHIYPSGRIPENSVLFSNTIATKGISSLLPEDYIPSMR